MASNPAFGKRLGERLREMGYWPAGRERPDVYKFALKFGYSPSAVYRWLEGEVPRAETLLRVCRDVQRQAHYLLLGGAPLDAAPGMTAMDRASLKADAKKAKVKAAKPIGGGSGEADGPHVADTLDVLLLIRRWFCRVLSSWARPLLPVGCPA